MFIFFISIPTITIDFLAPRDIGKPTENPIKILCENKSNSGTLIGTQISEFYRLESISGSSIKKSKSFLILNHLYAGQKVFNEWFKNSINHKVSRKELEHCKLNAGP